MYAIANLVSLVSFIDECGRAMKSDSTVLSHILVIWTFISLHEQRYNNKQAKKERSKKIRYRKKKNV